MEFLGDILEQYAVPAAYWRYDEGGPPRGEQPDTKALRLGLWEECIAPHYGGNELRDVLLALVLPDQESQRTLPLDIRVGDFFTDKGEPEAALRAYQLAVLEEDDPVRLCELGYLLLQRCRVDKLPLCDKDFDGSSIDFPGGETVLISSYLIDPDNPGPEFADKRALLRLAIRAFGLGYARCVQDYFVEEVPADNWWREFLALEGLRAAFVEEDNLDGLEAAIDAFYGEMEGFDNVAVEMPLRDILDPFVGNFRDAEGYLRARREAAPVRPDALRPRRLGAAEDTLRREHRDRWPPLPRKVRWLLTEAQFQQSLLRGTDADWAAVANWYGRAVEVLLRRRLGGKLDAQGLHNRFNDGHPYARAGIRDFVRLFELPRFAELGPLVGISKAEASMMAALAPDLETVASFRNLADHGDERTPPARGVKLRALVLGVEGQGGLLWKVDGLCNAD